METRLVTDLPVTEKTVGPQWDAATKTGNWDPSRSPIDTVYIHTMVGTAEGADARFNNPASCVSAHYGVLLNGDIWHWTDEDKTAYHAGVYAENQRSIGIEFEDNGNPNDSVRTDAQYSKGAELLANICRFYNIPCTRDQVKKHKESGFNTACCDGFDIDRLVREAQAILTPPTPEAPAETPVVETPAPAVEETPAPAAPAEAPQEPAAPAVETYQGLNLQDEASVKAAIDTWKEVVDGHFVRQDELASLKEFFGLPVTATVPEIFTKVQELKNSHSDTPTPLLAEICKELGIAYTTDLEALRGHIQSLKTNFKEQVKIATGIPTGEQIEGQGPVITAQPSLKTVPAHEKATLIQKLHDVRMEIEKLLGLSE